MSVAKCISNKREIISNKCYHNTNTIIKLPTTALPSFDGSFENWLEFCDTFISLIHNATEINPIQKLHYLRSFLKGSDLLAIKSLEFQIQILIR